MEGESGKGFEGREARMQTGSCEALLGAREGRTKPSDLGT